MKKIVIVTALMTIVACTKNKETKVESENTVIEAKTDTLSINTDTVGTSEAEKEVDNTGTKENNSK